MKKVKLLSSYNLSLIDVSRITPKKKNLPDMEVRDLGP